MPLILKGCVPIATLMKYARGHLLRRQYPVRQTGVAPHGLLVRITNKSELVWMLTNA